jgi:hypothetical protein
MRHLLHRLRRRRRPYDWRTERECEWLWDDLPVSHAKVVRSPAP